MNILLIEDNLSIIKGLTYAFLQSNYHFFSVTNLKSALEYINNNTVDLIILDVMLPDGNGFNFFKDVIKPKNISTIFLTARDNEDEIVTSLMTGAEDYLTKPFSTKELMARVSKVLLRKEHKNIVTVDDITFDLDKMVVWKGKNVASLSSIELKLLSLLFLNLNKVVRRGTLIDAIFDATGNYVDDHTITVYFNRIREKLATDIIITIKGVGYRIDEK